MQILDGKNTAQKINDSIREQILKDLESLGRPPRIDMILVGDEYGSAKYVSMKEKERQNSVLTESYIGWKRALKQKM